MALTLGQKLPSAEFVTIGDEGPQTISLASLTGGKRVVIFAVPGAFTSTCHRAHVPSFIEVMDHLSTKGIDAVICLTVNDPFVTTSWEEATGAKSAGIITLSDPDGGFFKAIDMTFSAPAVGLYDRAIRMALVVNDGTVEAIHTEAAPGEFGATSGAAVLAAL